MRHYYFDKILLNKKWASGITISIDEQGFIESVNPGMVEKSTIITGPAIPGFINCHSHAFQYAMAGLTEHTRNDGDNFWTWRKKMYDVALSILPQDLEAIACMLYSEMLRMGYIHVTEFHYLHHDIKGKPYDQITEMGERLLSAAEQAGIGITLVPIYYKRGGFSKPALPEQRRFISPDLDAYLALLSESRNLGARFPHANFGTGFHSIRAIDKEDLIDINSQLEESEPFHIHISEQPLEVEECISIYGKRPVEWLSEYMDFNQNMQLVHATHLDEHEINLICSSSANVILCPSTEGNLGDGIFRFSELIQLGGSFSIGSDSHIGLNPLEELRWLDYQQRLTRNTRAISREHGSPGDYLYQQSFAGGLQANGVAGAFEKGSRLTFIELNDQNPLLSEVNDAHLINTLIYSGDHSSYKRIFSNGKFRVTESHHNDHDKFLNNFRECMQRLKIR